MAVYESWLEPNRKYKIYGNNWKSKSSSMLQETFVNWNVSPLKNGETFLWKQLQISSKTKRIDLCYHLCLWFCIAIIRIICLSIFCDIALLRLLNLTLDFEKLRYIFTFSCYLFSEKFIVIETILFSYSRKFSNVEGVRIISSLAVNLQ